MPVTSRAGAWRSVRAGAPAALALAMLALALVAAAHAQTGPFGMPREAPQGGLVGWILAEQARFYRALSGLIRAAKTDGSAAWTLFGVSFIYGIFHAAGPGHGKAVISSYLVANEETWRRGVTLSFASALLQSLVAVVLVGIAAAILGVTAHAMGNAVRAIEIASYALIAAMGARLTWIKGRAFLRALHAPAADAHDHDHDHAHDHAHRGHAHHHHDHAHGHGAHEPVAHALGAAAVHDHHHDHHGHAHGPEPQELAGPGGWRRGLTAIVAVGLRPCSGAILVLVFALAQDLFWAGVVSTFVMGLGTAITVAAIATLAVGAKGIAARIAAHRAGGGAVLLRAVEAGAAALVMVFGLALLTGYMASERIAGF